MLKWILGFLLGCCSIFWLTNPLSQGAWLVTFSLFILLLLASGRFNQKSFYIRSLSQCLMGFCIGLLWLNIHSELRLKQRITQPLAETHIIESKLVSIPAVYEDLLQFTVKVQSSSSSELNGKKIKLSWYQYLSQLKDNEPLPKAGEIWRFTVRVKPIVSALNIAGFDAEKHAFAHGISAKATVKNGSALKLQSASKFSINYYRQYIFDALNNYQNAGVLQALVVGEKSAIDNSQQLTIQALGVNHLLAISGLHISIIAGLTFWLSIKSVPHLGRLGVHLTPIYVAAIASLLAALFYSGLAGFSVATVRAFIMWFAVVLALLRANEQQLWRNLAIALLVILLLDPLTVLNYGFWLSFAAVAIIASVLIGRVVSSKKWQLAIELQWKISLGMGLLALALFQQASLVTFIANLILIPVFSLLFLPTLFLGVLLSLLVSLNFLLALADQSLSYFFELFAQENFNVSETIFYAHFDHWLILLLSLVYLFYLLPISRLKVFPLAMLALLSTALIASPKSSEDYKLVIFDVGHGLANLIYNQNNAILYDAGYANQGFSYAQSTLIPSLRKLGVKQIDLMIISHDDLDHSGGAEAIKLAFPVEKLINSKTCTTQKVINLKKLKLEFYSTAKSNPFAKRNDQSCVVKVASPTQSVLLTGDIERGAELELLRQNSNLKADILISPHHGSNTSSTYPFIKTVAGDLVIHSTNRFNRFGFPKPKVQKRYQEMSYEQLSTGCSGMLSINLMSGQIQQMRQQKRIWRLAECEL